MPFSLHIGELEHADVQALLALHVAAMRAQSPLEACHVLPAASLSQAGTTFFSARSDDGTLLGIGALKRIDGEEGEVKSMRTAPSALGKGVGRFLLEAITAEARRAGMRRLRLETGADLSFAAAIRLYESYGFQPGEPFGGYPPTNFTRFYRLDL